MKKLAKTRQLPAQMMVVTLIVMMILSIITVTLVGGAISSANRVQSDSQYQQLFASSEQAILTMIDEYGRSDSEGKLVSLQDLPTLPTDIADCSPQAGGSYLCELDGLDELHTTELTVADLSDFYDYELEKDQALTLKLNDYGGEILLSWTGEVAIDFGLFYRDAGTSRVEVIRDIYDLSGVMSRNGEDPIVDPAGNHSFDFVSYQDPDSQNMRFDLENVAGIEVADELLWLTVTPRMTNDGSTLLDIEAPNAGFPDQMRELVARTYLNSQDNTPIASARSIIPLHPQTYSLLEYALLSEGSLAK